MSIATTSYSLANADIWCLCVEQQQHVGLPGVLHAHVVSGVRPQTAAAAAVACGTCMLRVTAVLLAAQPPCMLPEHPCQQATSCPKAVRRNSHRQPHAPTLPSSPPAIPALREPVQHQHQRFARLSARRHRMQPAAAAPPKPYACVPRNHRGRPQLSVLCHTAVVDTLCVLLCC